jgi:hypothetical protein
VQVLRATQGIAAGLFQARLPTVAKAALTRSAGAAIQVQVAGSGAFD